MRRSASGQGSPRYGSATVPMEEARASCAIDIWDDRSRSSKRTFRGIDRWLRARAHREEFFRALANAAKLTLHLRVEAGNERPPT